MIKFTASFEWHDKEAVILELEHIGQLITQGQPKGEGWEITGEEESEPKNTDPEIEPELRGETYQRD